MNNQFWILDFGFWIGAPRRLQLRLPQPRAATRGYRNPNFLLCVLCVLCGELFSIGQVFAATGDFLLVRRSLQVQPIKLASINDSALEYLDEAKGWVRVPLQECIALLNPNSTAKPLSKGLVALVDGEHLPGEAVENSKPQGELLAWTHPWLGRVDVPIKQIQFVLFTVDAVTPPPPGKTGDVILLANGDRREGLILSLGNPITLEVDRPIEQGGGKTNIDIPLNLVTAVTMLNSHDPINGRRIWFEDGTVLDVQSIAVGDDGYVRLSGSSLASGTQPTRVGLAQVAAVLLDPKAMIPLASLTPTRVEGPVTRYVLPKPLVADPSAPLGLSKIEIRGPLVVRYALPAGCVRFTAEAQLPAFCKQWGDYDLVVKMNDDEVFRQRINAANPTATINVPVTGREMTIELTQGAYGPIQDQVILHRAMLLKKP